MTILQVTTSDSAPDVLSSNWAQKSLCSKGRDYIAKRGIKDATLASLAQVVQFNSYSGYDGETHLECHIPGYVRYMQRVVLPVTKKTSFRWDSQNAGNKEYELPFLGLKEALTSGYDTLYIVNGQFGYLSFYQITGQFNGFGLMGGEGTRRDVYVKAIANANFHGTLIWLCDYDDEKLVNGQNERFSHRAAARFRDALLASGFAGSFFALDYPNPTSKSYDLNDALIANPNLTLSDIESFPMVELPEREIQAPRTITQPRNTSGKDTLEKIINGFPIQEYIERDTGQTVVRNGNIFCPFCEDSANSKTPSFHIYPKTNSFHCFHCQGSGNVIGYVAKREGIPGKAALEKLARVLGIWEDRKPSALTTTTTTTTTTTKKGPFSSGNRWFGYHVEEISNQSSSSWVTKDVVLDTATKVVAIKAQTGRGKTWASIELMRDAENALYVAGYIRLCDAFRKDAVVKGVPVDLYLEKTATQRRKSSHLACCVPSLTSLLKEISEDEYGILGYDVKPYDILVIDEIVPTVKQLTTINGHIRKPTRVIGALSHLCNMAKKVVLLDANLDKPTIDFFNQVILGNSEQTTEHITVLEYEVVPKHVKVSIVTNVRSRENYSAESLAVMLNDIQQCSGPALVFCTTKGAAIKVYRYLQSVDIPCAKPIVGTESISEETAEILNNDVKGYIKENITLGNIVIYSPAAATGLDLDFSGIPTFVHCPLSKPRIGKKTLFPSDMGIIIQGMFRNRTASEIIIYGLPENSDYKHSSLEDIIKGLREKDKAIKAVVLSNDGPSKPLSLYSRFLLRARANEISESISNGKDYVASLIAFLEEHGYENIVTITKEVTSKTECVGILVKELTEKAKEVHDADVITAIPIDKYKYLEIMREACKGKSVDIAAASLGLENYNARAVKANKEEELTKEDVAKAKERLRSIRLLAILTTIPSENAQTIIEHWAKTEENEAKYYEEFAGPLLNAIAMQKHFLPLMSMMLDDFPLINDAGLLDLNALETLNWNSRAIKGLDSFVGYHLYDNNERLNNLLKTEFGLSFNYIENQGTASYRSSIASDFIHCILRLLGIDTEKNRSCGAWECFANPESAIALTESEKFAEEAQRYLGYSERYENEDAGPLEAPAIDVAQTIAQPEPEQPAPAIDVAQTIAQPEPEQPAPPLIPERTGQMESTREAKRVQLTLFSSME